MGNFSSSTCTVTIPLPLLREPHIIHNTTFSTSSQRTEAGSGGISWAFPLVEGGETLPGADPGGGGGGGGVEGVATPCFVGQGRQDSLASQTLPAREGLACETAPRSGPLALTCKSRCHPR